MKRLTTDDIAPEARGSIATIRCLMYRWLEQPPRRAMDAVAVRADGRLVVARMSRRGVTVRRNARPDDLVQVWSR